MDTYNSHPKLIQFYIVFSTSIEKSGTKFISRVKGNFHELDHNRVWRGTTETSLLQICLAASIGRNTDLS